MLWPQVEDALYSLVEPTPTGTEPYLVAYSKDTAALLDLEPQECERCVEHGSCDDAHKSSKQSCGVWGAVGHVRTEPVQLCVTLMQTCKTGHLQHATCNAVQRMACEVSGQGACIPGAASTC